MKKRAYSIPLAALALSSFGCPAPEEVPVCGDGALDAGEECDDGNTAAGDGCDAVCVIEVAEDEVIDSAFTITVINGYDVPYVQAAQDINGDGTLICDIAFTATDVSFAAGVGSTTYNVDQTNCVLNGVDDPASNVNLATYGFDLVATAVTINAQYDITLTDDGGVATELACTFANGLLDCGVLAMQAQ